jgi:V8-like Glu-specific endopeptidase
MINMLIKCLIIALTLPSFCLASIFGIDDRVDFFNIKNSKIIELTKSTPSIMRKENLKLMPDGDYQLVGKSLVESFNFCEDAPFATQPLNANCSSALISKDTILTAAHCINKEGLYGMGMDDLYVVFDYKRRNQAQEVYIIPKQNVYKLKKVVYRNFDNSMYKTALDLAIYKLDRETTRKPVKVNTKFNYSSATRLYALGYPLGVPQKLTPNGVILDRESSPNSFKHNLDTFSVNSGSPIFDEASNEIIGVHVRGTGSNYKKYGRDCTEWFKADEEQDYGEANSLSSLDSVILNSVLKAKE